MLHRIFLAINLPPNFKKRLIEFQNKWSRLPCRFVNEKKLHLTLVFLGGLNDNQLREAICISKEVGKNHQPFLVQFEKIAFGPDKKFPPRLIWLEGEKSPKLSELQTDLEDSIYKRPSCQYKTKKTQSFRPHITLARVKQWEFRRLEEIPEIDENMDLSFEVNSFDIMESYLKKSGAEYEILESIILGSD